MQRRELWSVSKDNPPPEHRALRWKDASPRAQPVKSLPARQETQGPSLGLEDPLEKEMATHSSVLFFFFISWRLITLQYCSGFCHTST